MATTILIFLALVNFAHCDQIAFAKQKGRRSSPPKLALVKDRSLVGECGCAVYRTAADSKKDRYLLLSDYNGNGFINVDGEDVKLRLVSQREKDGEAKIGDHSWQTFVGGKISLRIDFFVSRVCPPNDESCEVTWYRVKLTVSRGAQHTFIRAQGMCGC